MVATATIALVLAFAGLAGGSVFFLEELNNLLALVIGNVYYVSLILGAVVIGGGILLYFVRGERINYRQAMLGFLIVLMATALIPAVGMEIGRGTTSYSAQISISTTQHTGLNAIEFDNMKVSNVERTGPDIFNFGQQTSCIVCGDWTAEVVVSCNDGAWTKKVSLTGPGGGSDQKLVKGMPTNSQCKVTGTMTKPGDVNGENPQVRWISTGE